jgi:hemerythrin
MEKCGIVEWDNRFLVGIQLIDDQHKELVRLINDFYLGCFTEDENAKLHFKLTVYGLVNYIKYHFASEEQVLERIRYPDINAHKRQHSEFVRELLERLEHFEQNRVFSIKNFIRYLRDWMVTHMTLIDKKYATYIHFINGHAAGRDFHEAPVERRPAPWIRREPAEVPSEIFFG